ncbi:hypothetical protein JOC36_000956 [Weissella uvarum]|uniref:hypothetical protein n=1 Tax=Weissella uvarum TaxID=1479233 RepID=UPI00195FC686|nr:hypothetical protein [Weissella uvarum]MBM7617399.1 hypothetical protein [Weissella uvarum]MCM0595717.1 hypothetical protein [Weissella uvarum]
MQKKSSKIGKIICWILGLLFLLIFGTIFAFLNFRTYGLYYAEQYYGKDSYFQLLREDYKTNTNPKEKRQYKDVFYLSNEDRDKSIALGNGRGYSRIYILSGESTAEKVLAMQSNPHFTRFYSLHENNRLHYDSYTDEDTGEDYDKKPQNFANLYKKDQKDFKKYMRQYFDIQLESIDKPIINLQWIYNIVQMK